MRPDCAACAARQGEERWSLMALRHGWGQSTRAVAVPCGRGHATPSGAEIPSPNAQSAPGRRGMSPDAQSAPGRRGMSPDAQDVTGRKEVSPAEPTG